jgi:hypothetical protein
MRRGSAAIAAWMVLFTASAAAQAPLGPLTDLLVFAPVTGAPPPRATTVKQAEPAVPTPRASCISGQHHETGLQGRVPAGAKDGYDCNVSVVSHQGHSGGYRVWRYVDSQGHECAYYDTTLVYPLNLVRVDGTSQGVAVVDMTDPAHPVQTDTLTAISMLQPHESLNLNIKRGLLAAEVGTLLTAPVSVVSVYSVRDDCRHPQLQFSLPLALAGHESGFAPDGKTFYASGTASPTITAIDLTDPKKPHVVAQFAERSHGLGVSDDGNRAYLADPFVGLTILDTSEIQARKPDPQVHEVSRLTWHSVSIPQNAMPFSVKGRPYLLETDEFSAGTLGGDPFQVGAARIIDIADERKPQIVSNLRLEVNDRRKHPEIIGDPGAISPAQAYTAHYCNVAPLVDPVVVACSFTNSGLRIFDITDLTRPKEIGYYVGPPKIRPENFLQASNIAMAMPQIIPERREVWYTDVGTGFYALRVDPRVWPAPRATAATLSCRRRRLIAHVRLPRGARVRSARATLAGKRVALRRRGRTLVVTVDLRNARRTTARLIVTVRLRDGRRITARRTYHPCTKR